MQFESLNQVGLEATSNMQMFSAETFHNQRIKLTADVKSDGSLNSARLWVDVSEYIREINFEGTHSIEVGESVEWTPYTVVFDVPNNSRAINFGLELSGAGLVWIDNVRFEVVSAEQ